MNKKLLFMGVFALFAAAGLQGSNARHKMACIKVGNPPAIQCNTHPLSDLNCVRTDSTATQDFANFAYTTKDWYQCFVKFDPKAISKTSGSFDAAAFKEGKGTNRQNCGFIYLNNNGGISVNNLKRVNQSISPTTFALPASSPLRAKLSLDDLAVALGSPSQLTIDSCLPVGGRDAVTEAKNFLGHALVDTSASRALTVQQQTQQMAAQAQQKATTVQTAMQKLCANPTPAYAAYCKSQGYLPAAIAPVTATVKAAPVVKAATKKSLPISCSNCSSASCVAKDFSCVNDSDDCAYDICPDGQSCTDQYGAGCPV